MSERRDQDAPAGGHDAKRAPYGRREYDRQPGAPAPPQGGRREYDRPPNGGDHGDGDGDRRDRPEEPRKPEEPAEEPTEAPPAQRRRTRRMGIGFGVVILVSAVAAALMLWRHHHNLRAEGRARAQEIDRGPRVFVAEVRRQPAAREVTLPADVRGFSQSTVYAKVSGYVKSIAVDKGDAVTKGQLLAVLESPEVDQQVAGAVADLVIKQRTFERYRQLVAKDFVSVQDFETARAAYEVGQATLKQLRALQSYEILRAPFAGTVTARYVDPGALIPAATGSTQSALPLVDVADLDRLRILVFVQQDAAPFVHVGDPVTITVDERPELKITAPIARFARALDLRSRAMLCEIWLDNSYRLYPGTFVHVTLRLETPRLPVIPSAALVTHDNQPAVAVVEGSRIHFKTVRPGLDDGQTAQILSGLQPGERVALAVPAEIADGAQVQPIEKKDQKKTAAGGPQPGGGEMKDGGQTKDDGGAR